MAQNIFIACFLCDFWWLAWLLPFLLGLLFGWFTWAKYRGLYDESTKKLSTWKSKTKVLEEDLESQKGMVTSLQADVSNYKARLSDTGSRITTLESRVRDAETAAKAADERALAAAKKVTKKTAPKKAKVARKTTAKKTTTRKTTKNTTAKKATGAKKTAAKTTAKKATPKKATTRKVATGKPDNLKLVEGIGPKIEGLLHAAGIKTFDKLSKTKVTALKKILEDAGPRYRIAVPKTWPKQAGMAAKGKMDALKKYQDTLKGGR